MTVACARCHDHKFDPIPTTDYYALYGILKSSRYQQAAIDRPETFEKPASALDTVRTSLNRPALAAAWIKALADTSDDRVTSAAEAARFVSNAPPGKPIAPVENWIPSGAAFSAPALPGDVLLTGDEFYPFLGLISRPLWHSGRQSRRFEGVLRSPTFTIDSDYLHLRGMGIGGRVNIVIENFVMIRDPIYGPLVQSYESPVSAWRTIDVRMWKGRRAYLEVADSGIPLLAADGAADLPPNVQQASNSWIALEDARLSDAPTPPAVPNALAGQPAPAIRAALTATLERWSMGDITDADSDSLSVWNGLLTTGAINAQALAGAARAVHAIEVGIPAPTRALAMCDGPGDDETVFRRGSWKTPGPIAPRLHLAVCNTEAKTAPPVVGSGRLWLANQVASPTHPLTARVMVNRIWKHHFGVGLVPTTDDFGHMGEKPTHPELLDWLASEFVAQGWSIKKMHRLLVLSNAYRMSSDARDPAAEKTDPKNALLHRANVRRLEAEAIRDSMLAVSGRLDTTMFGPGIYPNLPVIDARGGPPNGPLDGNGRRTIYLAVRRNFLAPFLLAFDFPTPFTTIGRRTVSNVPAQALALLNGEFVRQQAGVWAERLIKETPNVSAEKRVAALYQTAFGRPPTGDETAAAVAYLDGKNDGPAWSDLCHALFNVKEFVYVR